MSDAGTLPVDTSPNKLITALGLDTDDPVNPVVLCGFFGPSKKQDFVRLYFELGAQSFCEIPSKAILFTEPVDPHSEFSPTKVLVKPDAELELVARSSRTVEASFLCGAIASKFPGPEQGYGLSKRFIFETCEQVTQCTVQTQFPTTCHH